MRLTFADELKEKIRENPLSQIENVTIVEAVPVKWIKEWNIEHWESANDGEDMMVDRMMKDWWQENVDDQEWDDQWEQHLAFERWMKDV